MPDLIQVADDLKNMPDAWLGKQMTNPTGEAPPWLVASEVARRQKLRSGAAQAQAPTSSVSQDLIRSLYAKIPPTAGLAPPAPGMPPVNLSPGGSSGALGSAAPGTPPANLRMPARPMAEGGSVDDQDDPDLLQPTREEEMGSLYPPEEEAAPAAAPPSIDDLVEAAAKKHRIAPEVIRSLIRTESNGQAAAASGKGARGLMQIMPSTAAGMGVDPAQLSDPAINIDTGTRYLRQQLDKYGDLPRALAAYNAGPGAVDKYQGVPPFRETTQYVDKVLKLVNQERAKIKLPPLTEAPQAMRSRLLAPAATPPPVLTPDQQIATGAAKAIDQREYANNGVRDPAPAEEPASAAEPEAIGSSDNAAPAAAPPAAAKPTPLQQTWTPPEPQEVTSLKQQQLDLQAGHKSVDQRMKDLYGADNLKILNEGATALIGKPQDYSKYQRAIDNVMQAAQQQMHPSIGDALMTFGMALMASHQHNFGIAAGEAGSYTMQAMQHLKQQGTKDYLEAARAGVALQDKIDEYNAKIGQYKMQRLGAQQTGVIQDERTYQTQLGALQKQIIGAQSAFDKATTTPAAQQLSAVAILNEEGIPLDPALNNPAKQVSRDVPHRLNEVLTAGKGTGAAPKAPPMADQYLQSAIQFVAQAHGITLPANRSATLQDLPNPALQQEAVNKNAEYGAQRTITAQEAAAKAAQAGGGLDLMSEQALNGQFTSRNPFLLAKVYDDAARKAKERGLTSQQVIMERNAAHAAKGALDGLTKTTANVEAFSKLAEANMQMLQASAAKVVDLGAPVLNTPVRDLARMWQGDARVSNMQVNLATVRAEVARVLNSASANGELSIPAKAEMEKLLGDNMTYNMLVQALNQFRGEMANRRNVYNGQLQELQQLTVVGGAKPPAAGQAPPAQAPPAGGQYRKLQRNGNITIGLGADNKWHDVATGAIYQ